MTISSEYRRRLVVMVKEPRPGKVKTRLGRDIGMIDAAWWFRHQSCGLLRKIQHPCWQTVLAVSPDRDGMQSRAWPAHLSRWPQGRGDIGARMMRVIDQMPPGPVVIIGADIPDITAAHIRRAFSALGSAEVVFGPAVDGGFWLIGMKRNRPRPPGMFKDVRWSTEHALKDSIASLGGRRISLIDTLRDVDTSADL